MAMGDYNERLFDLVSIRYNPYIVRVTAPGLVEGEVIFDVSDLSDRIEKGNFESMDDFLLSVFGSPIRDGQYLCDKTQILGHAVYEVLELHESSLSVDFTLLDRTTAGLRYERNGIEDFGRLKLLSGVGSEMYLDAPWTWFSDQVFVIPPENLWQALKDAKKVEKHPYHELRLELTVNRG